MDPPDSVVQMIAASNYLWSAALKRRELKSRRDCHTRGAAGRCPFLKSRGFCPLRTDRPIGKHIPAFKPNGSHPFGSIALLLGR
jgi:hypothetical protein